ncbi:MAG: DUF2442 domain-containing protein [Sulfuricurvum sp.]|nr:DUF2442 domain-containing protein [Sulfuricurvum sp.]MDD5386096.1 DUF2442 domain-containing protein [Sulfuricurvum sp.]
MNTLTVNPLASDVQCTNNELIVTLKDGRVLQLPLSWFPKLNHAPQQLRNNFEILGDGEGIYWEELDEDLSVRGFLQGISLDRASA